MVWLLRHQGRWLVDVLIGLEILPARPYAIELLPTETWPVGEENRSREIRADVVLRLWSGPVPVEPSLEMIRRSRVIGLILDFQLRREKSKELRLLEYDSAYPPVLGPNIFLIGLTLHQHVARWMRDVLARKQLSMRTCVLNSDEIPRGGSIDAYAEPRRALLEAMLHVRSDVDRPLLTNALRALRRFEGNELLLYKEMLLSQMKEPMIMRAYEDLEPEGEDEEDWSDDLLSSDDLESFLYVRGERQGRLDGERQGRLDGERQGRLEGRAQAILDVLRLRRIEVDRSAEARVLACREPEQLAAWLGRAMTITRANELFEP